MVEKVFISPAEVRGLGNIKVSTSTVDYSCYLSSISYSDGLFTMVYANESVTVTVTQQYVQSGGSLTVTVTVLDEESQPISGASVELFKEVN